MIVLNTNEIKLCINTNLRIVRELTEISDTWKVIPHLHPDQDIESS